MRRRRRRCRHSGRWSGRTDCRRWRRRARSQLHADPRAFVIALAVGASASFLTPIAYQTNMIVYGMGGYRFRDFSRLGLVLLVATYLVALVTIPVFFPLH